MTGYPITSQLGNVADILRKSLSNMTGNDYRKLKNYFDFNTGEVTNKGSRSSEVFFAGTEADCAALLGDVGA